MPKYYCDYCDVYLTHDSSSVRKAHNYGKNHNMNVKNYYAELGQDKAQAIIDEITKAYEHAGVSGQPGFPPQYGYAPGVPATGSNATTPFSGAGSIMGRISAPGATNTTPTPAIGGPLIGLDAQNKYPFKLDQSPSPLSSHPHHHHPHHHPPPPPHHHSAPSNQLFGNAPSQTPSSSVAATGTNSLPLSGSFMRQPPPHYQLGYPPGPPPPRPPLSSPSAVTTSNPNSILIGPPPGSTLSQAPPPPPAHIPLSSPPGISSFNITK